MTADRSDVSEHQIHQLQIEETKAVSDYGYCNTCNKKIPVKHNARENRVYLVKDCDTCGKSEALISSDAVSYYRKRELDNEKVSLGCSLDCTACHHPVTPNLVIIEVTNSCNMNCPICLSNVPSTGFQYNPPLEYFDRIFRHFAERSHRPHIDLFGGEPTTRDDLIDIVRMGRS